MWLRHLKAFSSKEVDEIFLPLAAAVTSQVDCTQCGNCCRHLEPGISEEEAGRLALQKGMPESAFRREFTCREPGSDTLYLNTLPCTFFDGRLCTIYENRPHSCRDFPHLSRGNIKFRIRSILHNYSLCPIVYNAVEALKQELNGRR